MTLPRTKFMWRVKSSFNEWSSYYCVRIRSRKLKKKMFTERYKISMFLNISLLSWAIVAARGSPYQTGNYSLLYFFRILALFFFRAWMLKLNVPFNGLIFNLFAIFWRQIFDWWRINGRKKCVFLVKWTGLKFRILDQKIEYDNDKSSVVSVMGTKECSIAVSMYQKKKRHRHFSMLRGNFLFVSIRVVNC